MIFDKQSEVPTGFKNGTNFGIFIVFKRFLIFRIDKINYIIVINLNIIEEKFEMICRFKPKFPYKEYHCKIKPRRITVGKFLEKKAVM